MPKRRRKRSPDELGYDEPVKLPDVSDEDAFKAVVRAILDAPPEDQATSEDEPGSEGESR